MTRGPAVGLVFALALGGAAFTAYGALVDSRALATELRELEAGKDTLCRRVGVELAWEREALARRSRQLHQLSDARRWITRPAEYCSPVAFRAEVGEWLLHLVTVAPSSHDRDDPAMRRIRERDVERALDGLDRVLAVLPGE